MAVLAVAACGPAASPAAVAPPNDAQARALAQAQKKLSDDALATLAGRSCPNLPVRSQLAGLPGTALPCLGTGPDRPVSAGDGRPTVVNLWASWCLPCVREMPLLQRTADRTGDAARFVGIDTQDARDSAAGLMQATGLRYPSYDDRDGVVRSAVRAVGLPVTLVFDASGREVARKIGEVDAGWLEQALGRAGVRLAPAS